MLEIFLAQKIWKKGETIKKGKLGKRYCAFMHKKKEEEKEWLFEFVEKTGLNTTTTIQHNTHQHELTATPIY